MNIDPRCLVLDLSSLRTGTCSASFDLDLREIDWSVEDVEPEGGTGTLDLEITHTDRSVIVRGRLRASFRTTCARCLEPAVFPVTEEVFAVFTRDDSLDSDTPSPRIPEGGREIPLLDAVREAVILSLPGKPLCRDDCRGLCQVCGANLNVAGCAHSEGAPDGYGR